MSYLLNCWYIASWSEELEAGKTLARTIVDTPIVLFRDEAGTPHALYDRCPHRFAPLSMGTVRGDVLTCGYHGLGFNGSGACAANPHGPVLRSMKVSSYAVHETHRAIWIWMGDQEIADPALIPDFGFFDTAPDSAFSWGRIYSKGNYELFSDNLLDLTHADYLHANSVFSAPFAELDVKVEQENEKVSIEYCFHDEEPNVLMRKAQGDGGRVDQRTHLIWQAPGAMTLYIEFAPAGTNDFSNPTRFINIHAVTPETATSTHYYFASTRNFLIDDAEINRAIGETRRTIFESEDAPMIDAQQARMGDKTLWELNPLLLKSDNAGVRARRILEKRIQDEQAQRSEKVLAPVHA